MRGVCRIPHGELAGLPAIRIAIPAEADPEYLLTEYSKMRHPGIAAVWVDCVDWGSPTVDDTLAVFQSDPRTSEVIIWAQRPATAAAWPATLIWYVFDASGFMAAPTNEGDMIEALLRAPFTPRPTELLVSDPAEVNLTPSLMDRLSTSFSPERTAWIEVPDIRPQRVHDRALHAACASVVGWGVRVGATGGRP